MSQKKDINLNLLEALARAGKEVRLIIHHRKLVDGFIIEPLLKLRDKNIISSEDYSAALKYSNDYTLANITHHARPSYGEGMVSSKKFVEKILQNQINASERVELIKAKVDSRLKKLSVVLNIIFDEQKSIRYLEKVGISSAAAKFKIKEICEILKKFYLTN